MVGFLQTRDSPHEAKNLNHGNFKYILKKECTESAASETATQILCSEVSKSRTLIKLRKFARGSKTTLQGLSDIQRRQIKNKLMMKHIRTSETSGEMNKIFNRMSAEVQ